MGASVRGTGHAASGQPCQDAHGWRVSPRGTLLAAVSDGAGSAPLSDAGSRAAVDAALEALAAGEAEAAPEDAAAWTALLERGLAAAREAVEREAAARGTEPRELACTLILVAATPELTAAAQVGDGAAVLRAPGGAVETLTVPSRGEYANETTFVVTPGALEAAQLRVRPGAAEAVAVISDGLQTIALTLATGAPHGPFFEPLLRFAAEPADPAEAAARLEAFLGSPRVAERTDDDVTLLLAVRSAPVTIG